MPQGVAIRIVGAKPIVEEVKDSVSVDKVGLGVRIESVDQRSPLAAFRSSKEWRPDSTLATRRFRRRSRHQLRDVIVQNETGLQEIGGDHIGVKKRPATG